ncbi:MAG: ribonuclease HII [Clostridia bacterium]|nr:ribonuclease HII [Clostridia bacterium]
MLDFSYEQACIDAGYVSVCGIDEAGRGPLAGNVVAAAVIMPVGLVIDGLNDSKKLSPKKREKLYDIITKETIWAVGEATPAEIDEHNILGATMIAMHRAVDGLPKKADFALIDGNCSRGFDIPTRTVVSGDAKVPSIAAASIIAKVTRDRECEELDRKYPEYGFAKHKGYPTSDHMKKVVEIGPCPEHRKSFLSFVDKVKNDG